MGNLVAALFWRHSTPDETHKFQTYAEQINYIDKKLKWNVWIYNIKIENCTSKASGTREPSLYQPLTEVKNGIFFVWWRYALCVCM